MWVTEINCAQFRAVWVVLGKTFRLLLTWQKFPEKLQHWGWVCKPKLASSLRQEAADWLKIHYLPFMWYRLHFCKRRVKGWWGEQTGEVPGEVCSLPAHPQGVGQQQCVHRFPGASYALPDSIFTRGALLHYYTWVKEVSKVECIQLPLTDGIAIHPLGYKALTFQSRSQLGSCVLIYKILFLFFSHIMAFRWIKSLNDTNLKECFPLEKIIQIN
jgi:hypothetical protein